MIFFINPTYTCIVSILINTAPKRPAPKRPAPKCPRAQTAAPKSHVPCYWCT